jgi:hypothetical protein
MLVPPRKEEDRAAALWITPCSRVPRPEPILTQELQWDQEYIGGSETRLGTMRALRPDHELLSSPGAGLRGANQLGLFAT